MSEAKVTVAIPTYNRARLLKNTLESVLKQDYPDFGVLVVDNASPDDTEAVVRAFADRDQRVNYVRNETNIGMLGNLNRAIEVNSSPYLSIFHDDDIMLPGFIRESVLALDEHPSAGFSFTLVRLVEFNGTPLYVEDPGDVPDGLISGVDYLDLSVSGRRFYIHPTSVMMRATALAVVGQFDSPHSKHTMDFNLLFRLVAHFDVVFVRQELVHIRVHPGQESVTHWRSAEGTGQFAMMAERIDVIAYLLQSERVGDSSYRKWLSERLLALNAHQSELAYPLLPSLYYTWSERLRMATQEIAALIPLGDTFILVDQDDWGGDVVTGRHAMPFMERDRQYWGPPADDETALREFERLRRAGASFIVFGWPAFWCLKYYPELHSHLRSQFRCVLNNTRVVVFDLRR